MNRSGLVQLASLPDCDNVAAEGWLDGVQVCEVSFENGKIACQLFDTGLMPPERIKAVVAAAIDRLRAFHSIPSSVPVTSSSQP